MDSITIRGLDGPAINGTVWVISEGATDLEETDTRREAVQRARSTWAAPGQGIKVVNTHGKVDVIREGDPDQQPAPPSGGNGGGGLFGGDGWF